MKSAFVTGANRGLGYGFVEELLKSGYRVFGAIRDYEHRPKDAENLAWIECDLESDASIEKAAQYVKAHTESLELLVNCAGVNKDTATDGHTEKVSSLAEIERPLMLKMLDVNAVAPLIVIQKLVSHMTGDPSFIVNISSERASSENKNEYANYGYRGSKAALNMFTLCSLHDLPHNVKTFAVHPGNVRSHMNPNGSDDPREQARKILAIMDAWSEEKNGKFLNYDGTFFPL